MSKVTLKPRGKGFTLIELLIVITIIGILAVALIPRIASSPARARDVQRKADVNNLASALELFYSDNGKYPAAGTNKCASELTGTSNNIQGYLTGGKIPADPSTSGMATDLCTTGYGYNSPTDGSGYVLTAKLEVTSSTGTSIYCGTVTGTKASDFAGTACPGTTTDPQYVVTR